MATLQTLPDATMAPAGAPGPTSLAVRSFLYAVFKHRLLVLGVFLLVFLASAAAGFLRHSVWRANTKVLVKLGETVQLAPAESPSKSVNLPLTAEVVNTEAEIVKSRQVIQQAVEKLGLKPEEGTSIDEMIAGMQLALTVTPTPASNVLQISYIGRAPDRAARMVNAITDVYLDEHHRVYRSEGIHAFYTEQIRTLETQMKEAQHRLRDYLQREHIVDVEQEIHLLNQDVIDQDKSLKTHRSKITGLEQKLVQLRDQMQRTPPQVTFSEEYLSNPTLQAFKDKLTSLEVERFQSLEKYLPDDRHVRDKEEQIASLRTRLKEEKDRVLNKQTLQENEVWRDLNRNVLSLEVMLADARAREPQLSERLDNLRTRLHELRDKRFMVNNLKLDADERAYAYDLYRKKQEESRISEAMKNQSEVSVSVVERANPPLVPENGPMLPLLFGLIGGIAVATAMAVAVEYLNRRLRFEEEVERYLELPVLAVIPDLQTTAGLARS